MDIRDAREEIKKAEPTRNFEIQIDRIQIAQARTHPHTCAMRPVKMYANSPRRSPPYRVQSPHYSIYFSFGRSAPPSSSNASRVKAALGHSSNSRSPRRPRRSRLGAFYRRAGRWIFRGFCKLGGAAGSTRYPNIGPSSPDQP